MNLPLEERRNYIDTFDGAHYDKEPWQPWISRNEVHTFEGEDYTRDMEESPGLREHFPKETDISEKTVFTTEYQKELHQKLTEMLTDKNKTIPNE